MSGFVSSCKLRPNALGDWQILPPAAMITQVGAGGAPLTGALAGQDDFNASGKCEVAGDMNIVGITGPLNACELQGSAQLNSAANIVQYGLNGEMIFIVKIMEEIEVAAGNSSAWGSLALGADDSVILAVVTRITQAPGSGATLVHVGRSLNPDEFLMSGPVALGSVSESASDGDGVNVGPVFNDIARVFKVTCNAGVIGASLKIRVTVFYIKMYAPTG